MTATNTWNYRDDVSQDETRDVVGYDVAATDGDIGKIDGVGRGRQKSFAEGCEVSCGLASDLRRRVGSNTGGDVDGLLSDHKEAVAVSAGSADTFRRAGVGAVQQRLQPAVVPEFGAAIDEAMQAACIASCCAVSIDLGDVTFMDSAGLNGLIAAMHVAAQHDCKLVLRNPPPQVRRLFEMTGVGDLFEIVDS